ncbi:MAG: Uma2 family endonuclease [Fimbriimonadales bacterium]|nr:Uma2 family endonuclease [Fimbriimonadales bacterium]
MPKTTARPRHTCAQARLQALSAPTPYVRYKFTPEQFHRMGELGLLDDANRYELLEGDIFIMPPEGPEHAVSKECTVSRFYENPRSHEWHIRVESPLRLGDSEPVPDVAIVAGRSIDYKETHPTSALLVIEISRTTLETDRVKKLPIYAQANIPECWIVNLHERVLEVYREPSGARYKSVRYYTPDETVCPLFAPDMAIAVARLFGTE